MYFVCQALLAEFFWVLIRAYGFSRDAAHEAVTRLMNSANVVADKAAADAGLVMLAAGGDFADGAIAFEARRLGADEFVSFDRKAVTLLKQLGVTARILAAPLSAP